MRAAIDVGSNTVRMLLGSVTVDGRLEPVEYLRQITRLGGGFSSIEGLSREAMGRTLATLCAFAERLAGASVESVAAVGTAALRRAPNGAEFVRLVQAKTGLYIEIITGEEEAQLAATGVLAALDQPMPRSLIFDIGGGSTEFILVVEGVVRFQRSYPLGVVTLCEQFPGKAAQQAEINRYLGLLRADLADTALLDQVSAEGCLLVGTAGTVTSLAALELALTVYDWRRVNNLVLAQSSLHDWHRRLAPLSALEREALPGLERGRGDLILPGLDIVLATLELFGKSTLRVSDFGLLEGLLLKSSGAAQVCR